LLTVYPAEKKVPHVELML